MLHATVQYEMVVATNDRPLPKVKPALPEGEKNVLVFFRYCRAHEIITGTNNIHKDSYETIRSSLGQISDYMDGRCLLIFDV